MRAWIALLLAVALGACGDELEPVDDAQGGPLDFEVPAPEAPAAFDDGYPLGTPRIGRFPRSQFHIDHDRFMPATDPKTMPGADVRFLKPEDEVYGVLLDGHARAYPVRMISYYHVVNDRIDGVPIAVTY